MSEGRVKRKNLWQGMNDVTQRDWIMAAEKLNLRVVYSTSGTSHFVTVRDPKNPNNDDIGSLITTITPNCYKQANRGIFKQLRDFGVEEDDIWRALRML